MLKPFAWHDNQWPKSRIFLCYCTILLLKYPPSIARFKSLLYCNLMQMCHLVSPCAVELIWILGLYFCTFVVTNRLIICRPPLFLYFSCDKPSHNLSSSFISRSCYFSTSICNLEDNTIRPSKATSRSLKVSLVKCLPLWLVSPTHTTPNECPALITTSRWSIVEELCSLVLSSLAVVITIVGVAV